MASAEAPRDYYARSFAGSDEVELPAHCLGAIDGSFEVRQLGGRIKMIQIGMLEKIVTV